MRRMQARHAGHVRRKLSIPSLAGAAWAAFILLTVCVASAQKLFVGDPGAGAIYQFSSGGIRTVFASVDEPQGLTFDSSGNLFVSVFVVSDNSGSIIEFTNSAGTLSTNGTVFASGLQPW